VKTRHANIPSHFVFLSSVKRLSALVLLLLPILPFSAAFTSLKWEKASLRRAVKERMMKTEDESSFVHLAFANEEMAEQLEWEHSREFEYRGEMYDVVRQETRNDSTFFTLWWDTDETELNRKLARLIETEEGGSEESPTQIALSNFKVVPPSSNEACVSLTLRNSSNYTPYLEGYCGPFILLSSPPPEGAFSV
jgi:hypothetical protein